MKPLLQVGWLLLAGCGGVEPAVDAPSVSCPLPVTRAPRPVAFDLAVGSGQKGLFRALPRQTGLVLQRGCQGAQHVFTSIRFVGNAPGLLRIQVEIHRAEDDALVSVPIDIRLMPEADPGSDGARLITGLTPVIEVPRDVLMREAEVRVRVTDSAGAMASGSMRGIVNWGTDSCGVH